MYRKMRLLKKDSIFQDITKLKGVGSQLSKYLKKKKIEKIKDIIKQKRKKSLNIKCKFLNDSMTKNQHKKTVLKIKEDI